MLYVYAGDYMEVRTCPFQGIYHIVRYIGAKASLSVYPPVGRASISALMHKCVEIHVLTWAISERDCKSHPKMHEMAIGDDENSVERLPYIC